MLLSHAKSNVIDEGSLGKKQATISINPTIMHVLSRDLYSRPVEALFREVLTNALDAHVESGVESTPVDIKLPFYGSEEFYIRDYGKGLSTERMQELYLDYGNSTRRESNEFMGAFGLGCKSPLAYTSAFMVTSFFEGYKNEFLVYYDQDNIPCLDHRLSEVSDELSGLKVSLSLTNINDYTLFFNAAEAVLPYIPQDKYCLIDNTYSTASLVLSLPKGEQYGNITLRPGNNKLRIVMGYVAYNIDVQAVLDYLSSNVKSITLINDITINAYTLIEKLTSSYDVTITSELGRYPIHPSREHVNITPRAIAMLLLDLSSSTKLMLSTSENNTIEDDILYYKFIGETKNKDCKIRARIVTPSKWAYSTIGDLSSIITSYSSLIDYIATAAKGPVVVSYLSDTDFIDYLGGRHSGYSFQDAKKQNIIFIDEDNSSNIKSYINYELYDCAEDVEKFRRDVATHVKTKWTAPRIIVRSLQDTTHNVMILSSGIGDAKKCWASAKHNVESLQALNKQIYWVPTKMGCIKDKDALIVLNEYYEIQNCIPEWKRPIILGLPATKGTIQIERQFKPIMELKNWVDEFLASDYFKRRNYFVTASLEIERLIKVHSLKEYIEYGPTDLIQRIYNRGKKYKHRDAIHASNIVKADNIECIFTLQKEATTKFNYLSNDFVWYNAKTIEDKEWPKQLAELLNRKPTSAIYKNRGY